MKGDKVKVQWDRKSTSTSSSATEHDGVIVYEESSPFAFNGREIVIRCVIDDKVCYCFGCRQMLNKYITTNVRTDIQTLDDIQQAKIKEFL